MPALAAVSPSAYWFLTRGTGAVSLVLLTIVVALGIANVRRTRVGEMPRFVLELVHRNVALLAVSFVVVHIVTTLLDSFAPITLLDVVIPFRSAYRPLWLGFGTVAFDLLIAIVVTSLARRRLGYGAWRATHWLAYASWPVALIHGLGTGTDAKTHWMLLMTAGCVAVVLTAVAFRVSEGWPTHLATRLSAIGAAALLPLGLVLWLPSGPLSTGWAKQAGTPASLLARVHGSSATASSANGSSGAASNSGTGNSGSGSAGSASFSAPTSGHVREASLAGGMTLVAISLTLHGQQLSALQIRLRGTPVGGGGVQMTSSRVTLGPSGNPDQYSGHVTALQGTDIAAVVSDSAGSALSIVAQLQIAPTGGAAVGTVTVSPGGTP
jgi:Ferric reductase like transmembrane component